MKQLQPDIGHWFEKLESGELFEIVAIDEFSGTIEIQYLDGTLGEIDQAQWPRMHILDAAPPEDANAAYGLSVQDQSPEENGLDGSEANRMLDRLEGESFEGTDESPF